MMYSLKTLLCVSLCLTGSILAADSAVYESIQQKKQITIGLAGDYPPLKFNRGGKQVGVEVEMAKGIANLLNAKPVFKTVGVANFIEQIEARHVDIVLASISRNSERAKKVWFSKPYLQTTPAVLVDKRVLPQTQYGDEFEEAPIKTIWDLKRLAQFTFVARKGAVYEGLLKESFSDKTLKTVLTHEEALKTLFDRKADGYVHDSILLEYQYNKSNDLKNKYALLQGGHRFEALCVAMPFGAVKLKNQINLFIDEALRLKKIDLWMRKYSK